MNSWLESAIAEDFRPCPSIIVQNLVLSAPEKVAETHVDAICELCKIAPSRSLRTELCVIHTYICVHSVVLDSISDGHPRNGTAFLEPGLILSIAYSRISKLYEPRLGKIPETILHRLVEMEWNLRSALLDEIKIRRMPLQLDVERDRASAVGRADSILVLLRIVETLSGKSIDDTVASAVKEYAYCAQLADDLGDWREDFRRGNYSPILRTCFVEMGFVPTEEQLEEAMYLNGMYERRLVEVIRHFERLPKLVQGDRRDFRLTLELVIRERRRLKTSLASFVAAKHDFLSNG